MKVPVLVVLFGCATAAAGATNATAEIGRPAVTVTTHVPPRFNIPSRFVITPPSPFVRHLGATSEASASATEHDEPSPTEHDEPSEAPRARLLRRRGRVGFKGRLLEEHDEPSEAPRARLLQGIRWTARGPRPG